ncbi:MAG: hypothetical protein R8G01_01490 [Ilumatobacteraceae bacterium]|nr:hypothetical protein [Ilumatobacteraceae bacterium]
MKPHSLVLSIGILGIVVACSSGDDAGDPSTTTTTAPPATSSTVATTVASTSTAPSTADPTTTAPSATAPATTEPTTPTTPATSPTTTSGPPTSYPFPITDEGQPDWVLIAQELLVTGTGLSLEPDVDRITEYCLENSDCYVDWLAYIENLIADDAHAEGLVPDRVVSVEIGQAQGDRDPIETGAVVLTAQVEVVGNEEGARVADSNGNTLYVITREAQPGDVVEMSYFLGLNPENEWRVVQESTSES